MKLSEELKWRGFVNQTTIIDLKQLDGEKNGCFYHGYDASSNSLTVGNLAAVMLDKCFKRHGWKTIILAGGATSLIGDPGGKESERVLQPRKEIENNVAAVKSQLENLVGDDVIFVNNLDWYKDMTVLEYLRDVGKHFSMTPLIQRDYISKRIGNGGVGISYAEFSYTLLQGYDFLKLHKKYGATLQLAGSDQWGNSLSGVDLVRKVTGDEVHVLTMSLIINKTTGIKFGKSEGGAVWLDADRTSPSDFYQFWFNTGDESVEDYLKIFTELDKLEIDKIMAEFRRDKSKRAAQKVLAQEVAKLVHGEQALNTALSEAKSLTGDSSKETKNSPGARVNPGSSIVDVLVEVGLANSKTEARQLLASGGVYVNGEQTTKQYFEDDDFKNGLLKLRRGKTLKNTALLRIK